VGAFPPAVSAVAKAAGFVEFPSVQAPTVVAACLRRRRRRRRRRRLTPVVAAADDAGMLHVTVMVWIPAMWPKTTRAFRPLAIQRSDKAEKSAMETAGCDVWQAGSSTLPLATLAHVGKPSEAEGREETLISWHPACPARSPATPEEGEAEWRGAWRAGRTAGLLRPPAPLGGGGGAAGSRAGVRAKERGDPSSTRVSSELKTRVSSELNKIYSYEVF
jgi:hypothetical protein